MTAHAGPSSPLPPYTPTYTQYANTPAQNGSPPSKRDLASWWRTFKKNSTKKPEERERPSPDPALPSEETGTSTWLTIHPSAPPPPGIFGVPLKDSIPYANVTISLTDDHGQSFTYGYVPIVVAKCGVFLKEQGKIQTLSVPN